MCVTGDHWFLAAMLLQAAGAALCLVMVFGLARAIWPGSRAPWLSAGLLAIHGPFMFEMLSLRETVWFTLALLGVAWLLLKPTRPAANAAALGALLASLYLLRPTGLMVCGVTVAFLAWKAACLQPGAVRRLAITLVAGAVLVAPWQTFTSRNFGAPGFFPTSSSGYNLAKGADADLAMVSPWIDADTLDPRLRQLTGTIPGTEERATDKAFKQIAIGLIRKNPSTVIYRSIFSAAEFVSPLPIPLGTGTLRQTDHGLIIENFRPDWEEIAFTPVVILLLVSACGGFKYFLCRKEGPSFFGTVDGGRLYFVPRRPCADLYQDALSPAARCPAGGSRRRLVGRIQTQATDRWRIQTVRPIHLLDFDFDATNPFCREIVDKGADYPGRQIPWSRRGPASTTQSRRQTPSGRRAAEPASAMPRKT